MEYEYKFEDKTWNLYHSVTGKKIGEIHVNGDCVRAAYDREKHLSPSFHEEQIFQNAAQNLIAEHGLNHSDVCL